MATRTNLAKAAITIGPFAGGMNTYSDPSSIADNELVDSNNYEVALDGSLVSRPPIQSIDDGDTIGFTERIYTIGSARIGGTTYIFGSNADGLFRWSSGSWTLISSLVICSAAVQYNDVVYFLPFPNNTVYALVKWTPSGGFADVSPANLKTMMGGTNFGGSNLVLYKDRLFIYPGLSKTDNQSRLIFSDAGNPESYTATTQFVDINPGDGERLMDGVVQDDNLVSFKEDSTYVFTFTSTPADAELVKINPIIGVTNYKCVESFENAIYVLHRGSVYEIVNYNFNRINVKLPFVTDTTAPATFTRLDSIYLNRIGDRLVARWSNNLYIYGLRTKTWTRWTSTNDALNNTGPWAHYLSPTEEFYLAGSCLDNDFHTFKLIAGHTSTDTEELDSVQVPITCYIKTKYFSMGDASHFKRLNWWGVDAITKNDITGSVNTVVALFVPTWGDLLEQGVLWSEMSTWGGMQDTTLAETTIDVTATNLLRSFFRFPKAVRFRQAYFEIETTTDGSTLTGPARIFGITLVASSKELVPKDIN